MKELIAQGAEAKTFRDGEKVFKERLPKSYRHSRLDALLRTSRTKREYLVLQKLAQMDLPVPCVYENSDSDVVEMDYIDAPRLRDVLLDKPDSLVLVELAGILLARIHNQGIIHGDYTTSNILVKSSLPADIVIVDFGLSFFSEKAEDRAVDIHLAFQAFQSTHYQQAQEYEYVFLSSYAEESVDFKVIKERLEIVRQRGRNKH